MKNLIILLIIVLQFTKAYTQPSSTQTVQSLPVVNLYEHNTLHFISPQPIEYVDISSKKIAADIPEKNILRIKLLKDSLDLSDKIHHELGTITIVAQDFISQFRLQLSETFDSSLPTLIELSSLNSMPIVKDENLISQNDMKKLSLNLLKKHTFKPLARQKSMDITLQVNQIKSLGEYIFLDVSFINHSKLDYQIDEFRMFIQDRKELKARNFQSIEIKPEFILNDIQSIKNRQRNIYVIKKAVFSSQKIMRLTLSEKQLSGRMIELDLKYKNILQAESI